MFRLGNIWEDDWEHPWVSELSAVLWRDTTPDSHCARTTTPVAPHSNPSPNLPVRVAVGMGQGSWDHPLFNPCFATTYLGPRPRPLTSGSRKSWLMISHPGQVQDKAAHTSEAAAAGESLLLSSWVF